MSAIPNRYWVDADTLSDMIRLKDDISRYLNNIYDYDEQSKWYILVQMKRILEVLARIY